MPTKLTRRVRACVVAAGLVAVPTFVAGTGTAHADGPTCSISTDKSAYDADLSIPSDYLGTFTASKTGSPNLYVWAKLDSNAWDGPQVSPFPSSGAAPISTAMLTSFLTGFGVPNPVDGFTYHIYLALQDESIVPYRSSNDLCTTDFTITYHAGRLPGTGTNTMPLVLIAVGVFGAGAALLVIRRSRVRSIA
jgi:LPXTG-motif cell wall-anchored protein